LEKLLRISFGRKREKEEPGFFPGSLFLFRLSGRGTERE
jgi:hypothetical protein